MQLEASSAGCTQDCKTWGSNRPSSAASLDKPLFSHYAATERWQHQVRVWTKLQQGSVNNSQEQDPKEKRKGTNAETEEGPTPWYIMYFQMIQNHCLCLYQCHQRSVSKWNKLDLIVKVYYKCTWEAFSFLPENVSSGHTYKAIKHWTLGPPCMQFNTHRLSLYN